jgi:hypothetical protein
MHQQDSYIFAYFLLGILHLLDLLLNNRIAAQFPYYDNTCDFKSRVFDDYCLSIKIGVKHLVAHTILNMI